MSVADLGRDTEHTRFQDVVAHKGRLSHCVFLAKTSILAALLILFFFCPPVVRWKGIAFPPTRTAAETGRATTALEQLEHPFAPIKVASDRVLAWRLLFPAVWHFLNLPKLMFLAMPHLGCLLVLALIAHIAYQRTESRTTALFATVALGANTWFFVSTGWLAYFDSWLMGGLLLLTFSRSRTVSALVCLLIPWIDERFLLGTPLCLILRAVDKSDADPQWRKSWITDSAVVAASCLAYPLLRAWLFFQGIGHQEAVQYVSWFSWKNWTQNCSIWRYLEGTWMALRASWFFVALLLWELWRRRRIMACTIFGAALTLSVLLSLAIAADLSRSVSVVLPAAMLGLLYAARVQTGFMRQVLPTVAAASFLLPATHVMTGLKLPIFYVYAEYNRWKHPPAELDATTYLQYGSDCLNNRQWGNSIDGYTMALRLKPNLARAYAGRAMARIRIGDGPGSAHDAESAVRYGANDPECFFARALVRATNEDRMGAKADLREALRLAPRTWDRLPQALQLIEQINTQEQPTPPAQ